MLPTRGHPDLEVDTEGNQRMLLGEGELRSEVPVKATMVYA